MNTKIFLFFITLVFIFATPSFAFIATSSATKAIVTPSIKISPSVTVTPSDTEIDNNLKDRIKTMVQQNLSTTEAKLKEKLTEMSLVGYAGKVTAVTATNLTIDADGEIYQIATTDTTAMINAGQKIKLSTIAIADKILVIGTMNAKKDVITAKRIIVVKASTIDVPTIYLGNVKSVDTKKKAIVLTTATDTVTVILSTKANLKLDDFVVGKTAFVITRIQTVGKVITQGKIL
jgi:hypothetical protein